MNVRPLPWSCLETRSWAWEPWTVVTITEQGRFHAHFVYGVSIYGNSGQKLKCDSVIRWDGKLTLMLFVINTISCSSYGHKLLTECNVHTQNHTSMKVSYPLRMVQHGQLMGRNRLVKCSQNDHSSICRIARTLLWISNIDENANLHAMSSYTTSPSPQPIEQEPSSSTSASLLHPLLLYLP